MSTAARKLATPASVTVESGVVPVGGSVPAACREALGLLATLKRDLAIVKDAAARSGFDDTSLRALENVDATSAQLQALASRADAKSTIEEDPVLSSGPRSIHEQRMNTLGVIAAGVAHEMNNPLAALMLDLGWVSTVVGELAEGRLDARAVRDLRESLSEAREAGERIGELLRDVSDFSRADDDRVVPVDPCRVLDCAARMARSQIRRRARLVKSYEPVPNVYANETRLGQVVLNLVVNAAQAMPEGGDTTHFIRLATHTDEDGNAVIEVQDNGCGIAAEHLQRIFDPFFTTKGGDGTGLGLAICAELVTSMKGTIAVSSEVGQGTTFRVTLPGMVEESGLHMISFPPAPPSTNPR